MHVLQSVGKLSALICYLSSHLRLLPRSRALSLSPWQNCQTRKSVTVCPSFYEFYEYEYWQKNAPRNTAHLKIKTANITKIDILNTWDSGNTQLQIVSGSVAAT